jgi:hypothetical protein
MLHHERTSPAGVAGEKGKPVREVDQARRDELIRRYLPRAMRLAVDAYRAARRRWPWAWVSLGELHAMRDEVDAAAVIALVNAATAFDPSVNPNPAALISEAVRRQISKAMRDEWVRLRKAPACVGDMDAVVPLPRRQRQGVGGGRPPAVTFEDRLRAVGPEDGRELERLFAEAMSHLEGETRDVLAAYLLGLRGDALLAEAGVTRRAKENAWEEITGVVRQLVRRSEAWTAYVERLLGRPVAPAARRVRRAAAG